MVSPVTRFVIRRATRKVFVKDPFLSGEGFLGGKVLRNWYLLLARSFLIEFGETTSKVDPLARNNQKK